MRLRVSAVYPCHCSGIWCSAWAVVSCRVTVAWIFVAGALRWLLRERHNASPLKLTGAVAHQGGRSGRWWTTFEETAA